MRALSRAVIRVMTVGGCLVWVFISVHVVVVVVLVLVLVTG
jgi:hypothetical protein